ncbi:MAG: terminase large subunit, partial [Acidobacteriota bacterium]|nr:terminase large subunit [Acidobacteriota bacterium]
AYEPGVRTLLASMPRGQGKTTMAACLALRELVDGPPGAESLVVATDARQAGITLRIARRMVESDKRLSDRVQVFADRLECPQSGGVMTALPAEPAALHGWNPSLLICDEIHAMPEAVADRRPGGRHGRSAQRRDGRVLLAGSADAGAAGGSLVRSRVGPPLAAEPGGLPHGQRG